MLVVLDCNIWITLALNSQLYYITDLKKSGVNIASCIELRNEFADVLSRPKFNKVFSKSQISTIIKLHDFETIIHKTGKIIKITADAKDDYLFALASKSKADYIVTGDKLLLNVVNYRNTEVISFSPFKEIFRS